MNTTSATTPNAAFSTAAVDELIVIPRKPVSMRTVEYDRLQLREPTAAQMAEWDDLSGVSADVKAVAVVSGLPMDAVRQIGARDLIISERFIGGLHSHYEAASPELQHALALGAVGRLAIERR